MKKKGERLGELPSCSDPQGLVARARGYFEELKTRNYSELTLITREAQLAMFIRWCHERDLRRPEQIDRDLLERFRRVLFNYRKKNGKPLAISNQAAHLSSLRVFFRWLAKKRYMHYNPACELELPRVPQALPRDILSVKEVEQVLSEPDLSQPMGIRDRAIMELLYSTGMRRSEIINLDLADLHRGQQLVHVRHGKGGKARFAPVGRRAMIWLEKYLEEVRPTQNHDPNEQAIFLTVTEAKRFSGYNMSRVVRNHIRSGTGKTAGCHIFRHSMATAMLENGADIRYIQELLGHAKLNTTQVYTKVTLKKLREVHEKSHPAEQHEKQRREKHAKREPPEI